MLIERRDELFHLAVALIGHEVIDENHRAVLRNIRDDLDERAARGHIELEDVQIRHRDERVLRHHGHGLHGLLQRLHRKPLAAETVVVELLEPRRDKRLAHLVEIALPQVRLLSVKYIGVFERFRFQIRLQFVQSGAFADRALLCCHPALLSIVLRPVSRLFPLSSGSFPAHPSGIPPRPRPRAARWPRPSGGRSCCCRR